MIDFHFHFCDIRRLEEFAAVLRLAGVEKAALVSLPDNTQPGGSYNRAVISAIRKNPASFIGFGALDHRKNTSGSGPRVSYGRQVELLRQEGFSGIKLWLGKPLAEKIFSVSLRSEMIEEVFYAARESGMPVLYHAADPPDFWNVGGPYCSGDFPSFLQSIEDACYYAETFPDVVIIFAHLLFLAGGLDKLESLLVRCPNIYVDTAPGRWFLHELDDNRDMAIRLFSRFSGRILFGSDTFMFPGPVHGFSSRPEVREMAGGIKKTRNFFEKEDVMENDYPGTRKNFPMVRGLMLEPAVIESITEKNGEQFFTQKTAAADVFDTPVTVKRGGR